MFHTVKLSKSDPTPIYIQLSNELARLIEQGLLYEGMKLPTIRLLSKQLSINRDTVVSAYKLLEQQGLVESHIGKGTYIASHIPNISSNKILSPNKPHLKCSNLSLSPDFFPTTLCQEITSQIILEEGWEAFDDPLYRARHLLKQNAATFLNQLGVKAHFAQTQVVSSMDHFLLSLFKLSSKKGVCVETPRELETSCYLRSIGAQIYEVPLTPSGMDLEILEKYLQLGTVSYIFVMPYLQNPTGLCYTRTSLEKLVELANKYQCIIIEDGTYCDFLSSKSYLPLFNLCSSGKVIYLYHFSKLYLPHMKYSFAVLPTTLLRRLKDELQCSLNERFLQYYLASDTFVTTRSHILSTCTARYHYLIKHLSSETIDCLNPSKDGGLFLWCKISHGSYPKLLENLTRLDTIIAPAELFSTDNLEDYFRISISNLNEFDIDCLINTLSKTL